jgi:Glycosyl transferases, related to UDP-glucuronosyltransferase
MLLALSPFVARAFFRLMKWAYTPMFAPLYRLRADLGLPRGEHPPHSPTLVLALFSSLLGEPQSDWPPQTCVTGFPFYDQRGRSGDATNLPPELARFLDEGAPPLVFTLGSTAIWVAKDFYRASMAAAQALNQRALLLVGDAPDRLAELLPPGVAIVDYAPYSEVLPRARLIVHHGGIGTTGQSLRAGKPMLVVPFAHDQFDNAARITRLRIGRTLPRPRYTTARTIDELGRLLHEPSYAAKAAELGHRIRSEDGIRTACDAIEEELCHRGNNSSLLLKISLPDADVHR